jgi:hypothetical protein
MAHIKNREFCLLVSMLVLVILLFGCSEIFSNNGKNSGIGDGNQGGNNGGYTGAEFVLRFVDSQKNPMKNIRIDFFPNANPYLDHTPEPLSFVSNVEGKIFFTKADLEYLLYDFSTGKKEPASSEIFHNGKKISKSISAYDVHWSAVEWYGNDVEIEKLELIRLSCEGCLIGEKKSIELRAGETADVELGQILYVIPVPETEIFKIEGNSCHFPDNSSLEFSLPEECAVLDEPIETGFFDVTVSCNNNILEENNCVFYDYSEDVVIAGGKLVKLLSNDKTLIECQQESYQSEEDFVREYDFHPGPLIGSFYLGYSSSSGELKKINDVNSLFEFLAPFDSEQKVWEAIRLAHSDGIYCEFESKGYPPAPPEGYVYDTGLFEFENFLIPKEEISVSHIEQIEDGWKVKVLAEKQGCPCFIDYYEKYFELSIDGKISNEEIRQVYSAWDGCIC